MEKIEKPVVVFLAAGAGNRFDPKNPGQKQITKVDKDGNFIIDYSIYDAQQAGFENFVIVIKQEQQELFSSTVSQRHPGANIQYAYQSMDKYVPFVPEGRTKPWGTAHAVLCAEELVGGDFVIVNADDLYGREAFESAAQFMSTNQDPDTCAFITYEVGNTLTEHGAVKRGICGVENGVVTEMIESKVERVGDQVIATPLDGGDPFKVNPDHPVSMNMICMNANFMGYLKGYFGDFIEANAEDLAKGAESKCECLIQNPIQYKADQGEGQNLAVPTTSEWKGITHAEDLPPFKAYIEKAVEMGRYPEHLCVSEVQATPTTQAEE